MLLGFNFSRTALSECCAISSRDVCPTFFDLHVIMDKCVPCKIGLLPFCLARLSPTPFLPCRNDDFYNASPSLPLCPGVHQPAQVSSWDSKTLDVCTSSYPFSNVAALCIAAASSEGSGCFADNWQKCVLAKSSPLFPSNGNLSVENLRRCCPQLHDGPLPTLSLPK